MNKAFGLSVYNFLIKLNPDFPLPENVQFLLPYKAPVARRITKEFYKKYYNDTERRIFIIGINPGRHGAGITGIAFTDPVNLEKDCGIANPFQKKAELSSDFIYKMINHFGGVQSFYGKFFLTSICPIGFIKNGKNINYYDDKKLEESGKEFIVESMKNQIKKGANRKIAICLGEGKNFLYLKKLNDEMKFFNEIIPLAHPRYIMQYRRKEINSYIKKYILILNIALEK